MEQLFKCVQTMDFNSEVLVCVSSTGCEMIIIVIMTPFAQALTNRSNEKWIQNNAELAKFQTSIAN